MIERAFRSDGRYPKLFLSLVVFVMRIKTPRPRLGLLGMLLASFTMSASSGIGNDVAPHGGAGGNDDSGMAMHRGLNLPPTQGTTNAGAFLPGVYVFDYSPDQLRQISESGFTHVRIPVNVETANDREAMKRIGELFAAVGDRGIICMFDTNEGDETGHGNGKPNDIPALAGAWRELRLFFRDKPDVMFELFNEPFGYARNAEGCREYLSDMKTIIRRARLPSQRCILDGIGYAGDIQSVAKAGWQGALGYHLYPNWLPSEKASAEAFSKLVQEQCSGIRNDVYITEFGMRLDFDSQGQTSSPHPNLDAFVLDGLRDAMHVLQKRGRPILGTYHWHGWDNGDTYSYWKASNRLGATRVREVQDAGTVKTNR